MPVLFSFVRLTDEEVAVKERVGACHATQGHKGKHQSQLGGRREGNMGETETYLGFHRKEQAKHGRRA